MEVEKIHWPKADRFDAGKEKLLGGRNNNPAFLGKVKEIMTFKTKLVLY